MITSELYPNAHNDAQTIRALADDLQNGQAFAAQSLLKTADYISGTDGAHLNGRYEALLRVALVLPQTAMIINGLELVKLGNDYTELVNLAQLDSDIPTALALGAAINEHPFTIARIAAQHVDDVPLGELKANDIEWLTQEWADRDRARAARRHPDQLYFYRQAVSR